MDSSLPLAWTLLGVRIIRRKLSARYAASGWVSNFSSSNFVAMSCASLAARSGSLVRNRIMVSAKVAAYPRFKVSSASSKARLGSLAAICCTSDNSNSSSWFGIALSCSSSGFVSVLVERRKLRAISGSRDARPLITSLRNCIAA